MSVSVLIPAHNEEQWLGRTIANIFNTSTGECEVIVVLNGNDQPLPVLDDVMFTEFTKVIRLEENMGERIAMNKAAEAAKGTHLLRIDAHCDFSPKGWDQMLEEVTGPKDMTQAVLTATDKNWKRIPGHWYERTRLLPNMEAKWEKPNEDKCQCGKINGLRTTVYCPVHHGGASKVVPNMSSTGCGFMLQRDFYAEIGGANENYPKMGAIGEEFAVKTWLAGGKVQTRTDVIIGHIFDTGGYGTDGVIEARKCLVRDFGDRYEEIRAKFPDLDWQGSESLKSTDKHSREEKGIIVRREDKTTTKDQDGNVIRFRVHWYEYHWLPSEHPGEGGMTEEQIRAKYGPIATFVAEKIYVRNDAGNMVDTETKETYKSPKDFITWRPWEGK